MDPYLAAQLKRLLGRSDPNFLAGALQMSGATPSCEPGFSGSTRQAHDQAHPVGWSCLTYLNGARYSSPVCGRGPFKG